jgi:hypothetical protein
MKNINWAKTADRADLGAVCRTRLTRLQRICSGPHLNFPLDFQLLTSAPLVKPVGLFWLKPSQPSGASSPIIIYTILGTLNSKAGVTLLDQRMPKTKDRTLP